MAVLTYLDPVLVSKSTNSDVVTTSDMQTWLRVDSSTDSTLISELVSAAIDQYESDTGIKTLDNEYYQIILHGWPSPTWQAPFEELTDTGLSVTYTDTIGDWSSPVTLSSSKYVLEKAFGTSRIRWIDTLPPAEEVKVTFTTKAQNNKFKQETAIKLLVSSWYDTMSATGAINIKELPLTYTRLINSDSLRGFVQ